MPRRVAIRLPKMGMTAEEAILSEWLVSDGATATEGEVLYRMETDKVETDIDAPATGVVRWTAALGETYPVGTEIGEILVED